jgi:hypothetical protein
VDVEEVFTEMGVLKNYFSHTWFRIKWLLMSKRDRYAYLWSRTKARDGVVKIDYSHPTLIKVGNGSGK